MTAAALAQLRQARLEIKVHWRPLAIFKIWFAIIGAVLFAPAFAWVLDSIVSSSVNAAISNYDLAGFLSLAAWPP